MADRLVESVIVDLDVVAVDVESATVDLDVDFVVSDMTVVGVFETLSVIVFEDPERVKSNVI